MHKRSILIPFFICISIFKCFSQAGTIDSSFGQNGKITANFGFPYFSINAGCIQQDGKIIVAGSVLNESLDNLLIRFLPNGQLDNSFGNGGIVYTDIFDDDGVKTVISLPDGSIFTAGFSDVHAGSICKYHADGTADNSFGENGRTYVGTADVGSQPDIKIQADGKILFSGNDGSFRVHRLKPNGYEDSPSEFLGTIPDSYGKHAYETNALFLQADGKIIASGIRHLASSYEAFIIRLDSKGIIDTSFANKGVATGNISAATYGSALVHMDNEGRFVLTAVKVIGEDDTDTIAIMRFTADGQKDLTFGDNGSKNFERITNNIWYHNYVKSSLQDNKILLAATIPGQKGPTQSAVRRLNEDGTIDAAFGAGGTAIPLQLPFMNEAALALSQPDKKIVVVGYGFVNGRFSVVMTRFLPDGAPDLSMGTNGVASVAVGTGILHNSVAQCVKPLDDGKILAAGYARNGPGFSIVLTRFNADGTTDNQFGNNGYTYESVNDMSLSSRLEFESLGITMAMVTDKSGNIYIPAGSINRFTGESEVMLFKFTPDGKPDPEFGNYGRREINIQERKSEHPLGLVLQSDGKPVIAVDVASGVAYHGDLDNITYEALIRLNTNGTIDSTYGVNGIYREMRLKETGNMHQGNQSARLAIQPDDKVILTGSLENDLISKYALGRYTKNGTPDTTFNGGRLMAEFDLGGGRARISSVAVQPDGKILAGGLADLTQICVTRYLADGNYDASFGNNGKHVVASYSDVANNIVLQPDGRILAMGRRIEESSPVFDKSYPQILRLISDGTPDITWGYEKGLLTLETPPDNFIATSSLAIEKDGRLLLAGATLTDNFVIYALRNEMVYCNTHIADAGPDTVMCRDSGTKIGLIGDNLNLYSWSPSYGLSNPDIAQPVANPYSDYSYVLTVTYPDGCKASDTMLVKVLDRPVATAGRSFSICASDSVTLGGNNTDTYTYSWTSLPAGLVSSAARPGVRPPATTMYYVSVNNGKCSRTDSTIVEVANLTTPRIGRYNLDLIVSGIDGSASYKWQVKQSDNTWRDVGTGTVFRPAADGTYRVIASAGDCSKTSEPFILSQSAAPAADMVNHLYPNPATNVFTLEDISLSENWETLDVIPLAGGQVLLTYDIAGKTEINVDISRLNKGYYLAVLKRKGGSPETIRFMKL
ncbi:T9SS type A sorting domain-containing protein [Chitinophaga sp. S165]|uniref:T9SS type A sorting domain-containing protein n=1 Tax=Chitinophaga sp. S165 TaxID=2135462 RepID=UPI000D70F46C|nr:T9SS type A sorting domain-containing protein [Chitinophaga sp. S165]PWV46136.1 putative delta-60 repeat protein/predicted secreted protein (Por secretion system target) [Chitinophaga sp. S165]